MLVISSAVIATIPKVSIFCCVSTCSLSFVTSLFNLSSEIIHLILKTGIGDLQLRHHLQALLALLLSSS